MTVREMSRPVAVSVPNLERLKHALAAGIITFLLTSLIVGIETVSSTGELTFNTCYKEVLVASIAVFFGSWVVSLMREGRPLPALFGGGGVTLVLAVLLIWHNLDPSLTTWLPFKAPIVNWGASIVPSAIFARAQRNGSLSLERRSMAVWHRSMAFLR